MTYMLNGKQYLVLAISGPAFPAELIAYTVDGAPAAAGGRGGGAAPE
jgi:hypothetical protein